jgi:hypothetical protein
MGLAVTLVCDGSISEGADGAALCSGVWLGVPYFEPFEISQLDPQQLGELFAYGFTAVGAVLLVGLTVRTIIKTFV